MTRFLLILAFVLFVTAPVRADMGPFIPAAKYAGTTTSRIEIADPLPGHVGVFVRSYGPPKVSSESEFVPLTPGAVLEFAGRYHDRAELLIVPRAATGPYPTAKALAEAVSAGQVPAVSRTFWSREALPAWGPSDIALDYRVRANAGAPEIVRTSWSPLWQWYVAALACASGVLFGGAWLTRRIFRSFRAPHAPTPQNDHPSGE